MKIPQAEVQRQYRERQRRRLERERAQAILNELELGRLRSKLSECEAESRRLREGKEEGRRLKQTARGLREVRDMD